MPRILPLIALMSVACLLSSPAHAARNEDPLARVTPVPANEQIPIIDFFRPALLRSPSLNDAGTHVAAIGLMEGDREGLVMVDLATMKASPLQGGPDLDIYWYHWLNDDRILFSVSKDKLFAFGLYVAMVKNLRRNYAIEQYSAIRLVGRPRKDPTQPIIWVRQNAYDDGRDGGLLQIDAMRAVNQDNRVPGARGTKDDSGLSTYGVAATVRRSFPHPPTGLPYLFLADMHGELAYAVTVGTDDKLAVEAFKDGKWIVCPVDLDQVDLEAVGDKPDELLVLGPPETGQPRGLYRMNALTGEIGELLVRDPEYDCADIGVHRDSATGRILGISYAARTQKTVWLDPARQQVQKMVEASFKGQVVTLHDADKTGDRFLVRTYSDRHPTTYHSLHVSQRSMGLFKNPQPWIAPERMRPQQILNYKARDGKTIEAFLTLPAGASKTNPAPLIVLPHGGPWARDSWGFDGEVQFLASRGYAVFQPNYRGSTGYDWRFSAEEVRDFQKMHEDVTDGVKAMLGTGLVDANRLAIMGASFGGYLAMCGAAFEPDLYRCAITRVGVFDWEQLLAEARRDYNNRARYRFWLSRVGDPKTEAERLAAISPLRHVDKVKIPIFVQHGREDNVVEVTQSKRLVAELREHGVPHVVRIDKGEGHGNLRADNRVELFAEIEAFLAKYLGPGLPSPAAP